MDFVKPIAKCTINRLKLIKTCPGYGLVAIIKTILKRGKTIIRVFGVIKLPMINIVLTYLENLQPPTKMTMGRNKDNQN